MDRDCHQQKFSEIEGIIKTKKIVEGDDLQHVPALCSYKSCALDQHLKSTLQSNKTKKQLKKKIIHSLVPATSKSLLNRSALCKTS